jgi:hypothetical protein
MRRPGRPLRIAAIALAALVFLLISAALARVLNANGAERSAIEDLIAAQARGDAAGTIARIENCARQPACTALQRRNATRLRSPGRTQIVRLDASTSFSFGGGHDGVARVVWTAPTRTTVVQCVVVRRGGDILEGLTIQLRSLSAPIGRQSPCPSAP